MSFEIALATVIKSATSQSFEYYPTNHKMDDEDVRRIKKIEQSVFLEGMSDAPNMPGYIMANHVFLKREDKEIIACIMFNKIDDRSIKLEDLIIAIPKQRSGHGKTLVQFVLTIADQANMAVKLTAPPRNQEYYSQFGFQVVRERSPMYWHGEHAEYYFPILQINMLRRSTACKSQVANDKASNMADDKTSGKASDKVSADLLKNKARDKIDSKTIAASPPNKNFNSDIELIIKFARYAHGKTSGFFNNFFRSAGKETAQRAIVAEMTIQMLPISQKRNMTDALLQENARAVLWNAMIVRGQNIPKATDSGSALYQLLISTKPIAPFNMDEINRIKTILNFEQEDYQSYSSLRSKVFNKENFFSIDNQNPENSPYRYYNRF